MVIDPAVKKAICCEKLKAAVMTWNALAEMKGSQRIPYLNDMNEFADRCLNEIDEIILRHFGEQEEPRRS